MYVGYLRAAVVIAAPVLSMGAIAGAAFAEQVWTLAPFDARTAHRAPVELASARSSDALPDGLVTPHHGAGRISAAWYEEPTTRYAHGVLGDAVEAGALVVETIDGSRIKLRLGEDMVFEDRYPRLADLDGDGVVEIIAIRSSLTEGAALVIYGLDGDALTMKAATAPIGRANRWLNVAGVADFTGAGDLQVAYVETPHIGGVLRLYAYRDGALDEVASLDGFSNHVIGSPTLAMSAVVDIDDDGRFELALPSADRESLRIVGFADDGPHVIEEIALPAPVVGPITAVVDDEMVQLELELPEGASYLARRAR